MEVTKELMKTVIRATLVTGMDLQTGRSLYSKRNFQTRINVTPENAYNGISALMSLQKHPVYMIEQVDESLLAG